MASTQPPVRRRKIGLPRPRFTWGRGANRFDRWSASSRGGAGVSPYPYGPILVGINVQMPDPVERETRTVLAWPGFQYRHFKAGPWCSPRSESNDKIPSGVVRRGESPGSLNVVRSGDGLSGAEYRGRILIFTRYTHQHRLSILPNCTNTRRLPHRCHRTRIPCLRYCSRSDAQSPSRGW